MPVQSRSAGCLVVLTRHVSWIREGRRGRSLKLPLALTSVVSRPKEVGSEERPPRRGSLRTKGTHRSGEHAIIDCAKRGMWSGTVPLVDVKIRVQVGRQTRRGRRAPHGLEGEIVGPRWLLRLVHAHVLEVEPVRTIRLETVVHGPAGHGQILPAAPRRIRRWTHGSQGRRKFHVG